MPKRMIIIVLAVLLAVAAVFLTTLYLNQQRAIIAAETKKQIAKQQEMQSTVLVANADIPKGTTIEASMFSPQVVPKNYMQPQAVSYPERIIGMYAAVQIVKGDQITLTKLISSKQGSTGSLAMATPIGKRAVTVSAENLSALLGMIKPGDYVDVISSIPIPTQTPDGKQGAQPAVVPLFQNILVLAVGKDMGGKTEDGGRYEKPEKSSSAPVVTLALAPQEASLITFVSEQGKIRLALRSPADSQVDQIPPQSWESLFQYLMPPAPEKVEEEVEKVKVPQGREIEIYRGLKRGTISVSEGNNQ